MFCALKRGGRESFNGRGYGLLCTRSVSGIGSLFLLEVFRTSLNLGFEVVGITGRGKWLEGIGMHNLEVRRVAVDALNVSTEELLETKSRDIAPSRGRSSRGVEEWLRPDLRLSLRAPGERVRLSQTTRKESEHQLTWKVQL